MELSHKFGRSQEFPYTSWNSVSGGCIVSYFTNYAMEFLFYLLEGKRHDAGILRESGLLEDLERHAFSPRGAPMCLYGDPAYPMRVHLQAPFKEVHLTQEMMDFNKSMSSVRVSVEWAFGHVLNSFQALDFKRKSKF